MQSDHQSMPRRTFVQSALAVGAAASALQLGKNALAADAPATTGSLIKPGCTILFQGDSITDAGRKREHAETPNKQPGMGNGYAWMTAAGLLTAPQGSSLTIYNRGISGHKVPQLAERWENDCINLKPDVLSILIGVNDIWHRLNGRYDGTAETYEQQYMALIEQTKEKLPNVKLVICEPFVLKCGAVNDDWFPQFDGYRAAAKKVAETHKAVFVPFQSMFDEAVQYAPPEHWAGDGVHPSPFGASLMAAAWIRHVTNA